MILMEHQRLPTSGARADVPFALTGSQYLIVPQLAVDVPGTPAHMNGGNSDVGAAIYRWQDGRLVEDGLLPLCGGEDAEFFALGEDSYLVTAGVRSGHGPYRYNIDQVLYRWISGSWTPIQTFPAFAAKQWRFFRVGRRAFLALAQGVTLDHIEATNPRTSRIYEWNGRQFEDFQTLEGRWGYNWESFEIGGQSFPGCMLIMLGNQCSSPGMAHPLLSFNRSPRRGDGAFDISALTVSITSRLPTSKATQPSIAGAVETFLLTRR